MRAVAPLMTVDHSVLAVGTFDSKRFARLEAAAEGAALSLECELTVEETAHWLEEHSPVAIVVQGESEEAQQAALRARATAKHATVPMIAVYRELSDLAFAETFSFGGDDAVPSHPEDSLRSRLRALPREHAPLPASGETHVLVADDQQARRIVVGRVLRSAGYQVSFALSPEDEVAMVQQGNIQLVVHSLEGAPARQVLEECGSAVRNATWIVTAAPRQLGALQQDLSQLAEVRVTDGYAAPENLLFLANELKSQRGTSRRATPRLLFGVTVRFRGAGREGDELGYSYNISEGGLYVRTLLPPEDDTVWLELLPPRSEKRTRLVGEVAWRRRLGPNGTATVPPGFGVRIVDGAKVDLASWAEGYQAFLREVGQ